MKEKLKLIEKQLKNYIEGQTAKIFGEATVEKKLVEELVSAMEKKIRIHSNIGIVAPNNFILNVPKNDMPDIRANQLLLDELAAQLMMVGEEAGLKFEGRITISVFPNEELELGQFELKASWKESSLGETKKMVRGKKAEAKMVPKAFLIVDGSKIFALDQEVVNIGRKLSNHLVIDDPRISREHCQLRIVEGEHMLFDLESSGGTFINGSRINKEKLRPGDVISIAGVPLVYGQDAIRAVTDSQEYQPPSDSSVESTDSEKLSDLDLDTFEG